MRWYIKAADLGVADQQGKPRGVSIALDYPVSAKNNRLLLTFPTYYVVGGLQATVRLYDKHDEYNLNHEVFLGRCLGGAVDVTPIDKHGLCKQLTVIAEDDALIWPGSGIVAWWEKKEVAVQSSQGDTTGR